MASDRLMVLVYERAFLGGRAGVYHVAIYAWAGLPITLMKLYTMPVIKTVVVRETWYFLPDLSRAVQLVIHVRQSAVER